MSCEYTCDGCGKKEKAAYYPGNPSAGYHKPEKWFERGDDEGMQVACSRECVEKISKESGKTAVILPI